MNKPRHYGIPWDLPILHDRQFAMDETPLQFTPEFAASYTKTRSSWAFRPHFPLVMGLLLMSVAPLKHVAGACYSKKEGALQPSLMRGNPPPPLQSDRSKILHKVQLSAQCTPLMCRLNLCLGDACWRQVWQTGHNISRHARSINPDNIQDQARVPQQIPKSTEYLHLRTCPRRRPHIGAL